jgi:hypothetical protein
MLEGLISAVKCFDEHYKEDLERYEKYKLHIESDYWRKDYEEKVGLYKKTQKALKKKPSYKQLIKTFLKCYWNWANYDELTQPHDEDEFYVAPIINKEMKKQAKKLFYKLGKELKRGDYYPDLLTKKYEDIVEDYWDNFDFLIWGILTPDNVNYLFYSNTQLPDCLKRKRMNETTKKQVEDSNINMLTWGEPRGEMHYFAHMMINGETPL